MHTLVNTEEYFGETQNTLVNTHKYFDEDLIAQTIYYWTAADLLILDRCRPHNTGQVQTFKFYWTGADLIILDRCRPPNTGQVQT